MSHKWLEPETVCFPIRHQVSASLTPLAIWTNALNTKHGSILQLRLARNWFIQNRDWQEGEIETSGIVLHRDFIPNRFAQIGGPSARWGLGQDSADCYGLHRVHDAPIAQDMQWPQLRRNGGCTNPAAKDDRIKIIIRAAFHEVQSIRKAVSIPHRHPHAYQLHWQAATRVPLANQWLSFLDQQTDQANQQGVRRVQCKISL